MTQPQLFPELLTSDDPNGSKKLSTGKSKKQSVDEPTNLGKSVHLTVPDFTELNRPKTCLELDFPIAPINALAQVEGNAGKPVYQMSKWWARRRSSVFRSLLIAAASIPEADSPAAKLVWDNYYAIHQKSNFKRLRVLDPFMGGGTTLVEGSRLGFQMTGIDLNPIAWFISKNELSCSYAPKVDEFFDYLLKQVTTPLQPLFITTCPRGHKGVWRNQKQATDLEGSFDSLPACTEGTRWYGPEIIYTFWAKHGSCAVAGCNHRTPIMKNPVLAEKKLTAQYFECRCDGYSAQNDHLFR